LSSSLALTIYIIVFLLATVNLKLLSCIQHAHLNDKTLNSAQFHLCDDDHVALWESGLINRLQLCDSSFAMSHQRKCL